MEEKKVSQAIVHRRATRIFKPEKINPEIVKKCLEQATLAPSSSNLQLWEFYHIVDSNKIKAISKAAFNQNAAKTASQIVIFITRKDLWKKRASANANFILKNLDKKKASDPKMIKKTTHYYTTIIPNLYKKNYSIFSFFKNLNIKIKGRMMPVYREIKQNDLRIMRDLIQNV